MTGPGAGATRGTRHQSRHGGRRVQEWKRRQEGREAPPANVSKMATFLTNIMKKEYTQEEIFVVLFESDKNKKRRQMLAIVTKTVDAHRLQKMRDLLIFEKLATWRRMNGFDRVIDGEDNWFHAHLLLPTPQEFSASLRSDLQELKNAISMPAETRPCQKTMDFVNALEQGKVSDEEFAVLKRLVEKRGREAAQVTVTPVDTVYHCSHCPLDPEPSPDVCVKLESNEGRMFGFFEPREMLRSFAARATYCLK